jgi:Iap family predicted aminopeptidase
MKDIREIEKEMLGEAYISDETQRNLLSLCKFGSRFAGTQSERKAVTHILKKMEEYNLENPHLEEIEYLGWKRGSTKLEVTTPIHKELDCIGLPWTPSTSLEGVEGEFLSLGDGTYVDYELHKKEIAGRIVMTTTFTPPWMRRQHRCEKLSRAENLGATGFIYAKNDPGMLSETGVASWPPPDTLGRITGIPALGISKEVASYLERLQKVGKVMLKITTNHTSGPDVTWNVVGDIVGKEKKDEIIIVGAHFDGHDIAPGAMDDAAGACIVLEAARLLSRHSDSLKRTIRFITFSGEETGCFGSAGHVLKNLEKMESVKFMFNLDGAGRASRPGVMLQGWPDAIPFFRNMSADMGQPMPVNVSFSIYSDHMPFSLRGIHTATLRGSESFTSFSGTRGWGHTKADTEDKVDIRDLREASVNLARILLRMSTSKELPFTRKSKDEIKLMLKKYEYDVVMKILGSFPPRLS